MCQVLLFYKILSTHPLSPPPPPPPLAVLLLIIHVAVVVCANKFSSFTSNLTNKREMLASLKAAGRKQSVQVENVEVEVKVAWEGG